MDSKTPTFYLHTLALAILVSAYSTSTQAEVEDPGRISWGLVEVTPLVDMTLGHNSNVYRKGNNSLSKLKNKSSMVMSLAPSAEFYLAQGLSEYVLTLSAKKQHYNSESDADFLDYGADVEVYQYINSRNRFMLTGGYGVYHDAGTARGGYDDREAPEYEHKKLGLIYGLGGEETIGRFDFFGSYDAKDYDSFRLNGIKTDSGKDRATKEYGSFFYYQLMPKTDALLEIKKRTIGYDDVSGKDPDFDITSYLVGLEWEATAKTSGFVKLGRRHRSSDIDAVDSENYTGWELGVSYQPLEHSVIQVSSGRDYGLESDDPTTASFTKGTSSSITWTHTWTSKITTRLGFSRGDDDIINDTGTTTKSRITETWSAGLDWALRHNMAVGVDWQVTDKNEDLKNGITGVTDDTYKQNSFMVSLSLAI